MIPIPYFTCFELKAKCDVVTKKYISKLENEIKKIQIFDIGNYKNGWFANATWYDYNEDMLLLSSRFPETLFELHGRGESYDDLWLNYYKDGKVMNRGLIIIRKYFDKSKLVSPNHIPKKYSYE